MQEISNLDKDASFICERLVKEIEFTTNWSQIVSIAEALRYVRLTYKDMKKEEEHLNSSSSDMCFRGE